MDAYDLQGAVRPFVDFIDDLTNWYIRRSRRRFWKSTDDADKAAAYATLYEVLLRLSKIAAPFVPFIAEKIYGNLRTPEMPESVHLCDFPAVSGQERDLELEAEMEAVKTVVGLGRQLRVQYDLKVRQPLAALHIAARDRALLARLEAVQDLVADELNVKRVRFEPNESHLARFSAKANYRVLGPKLGGAMSQAAAVIKNLDADHILRLLDGERIAIEVGGRTIELGSDEVTIERTPREGLAVSAAGGIVVAMETALTPELTAEGLAREAVNRIQNQRKTADLDVAQRIRLRFTGDETLRAAFEKHADYICSETLCVAWEWVETLDAPDWSGDLNGHPAAFRLETA